MTHGSPQGAHQEAPESARWNDNEHFDRYISYSRAPQDTVSCRFARDGHIECFMYTKYFSPSVVQLPSRLVNDFTTSGSSHPG